ncbi:MAG: hypothetical protein L0K86_16875, partial [Actinomycetia bacterium]|nr:hypothetical protein [Actinomycetes bacterium]
PLVATEWTPNLGGYSFVTDADYVAGGYVETTTGGWAKATVTPPFAGRFKALIRAAFSDASTEFDLDLDGGPNVRVTKRSLGDDASEPWMWWGGAGTQGWIDMGTISLGAGYSEALNPTLETVVQLNIGRRDATGSGSFRLDCLLLIPVDDDQGNVNGRTLTTDVLVLPDGRRKFYADGVRRELSGAYRTSGNWLSFILGGLAGRFGQVIPGTSNVLYIIRNTNTGNDNKLDDTDVTLSYYPRRLYPLGL